MTASPSTAVAVTLPVGVEVPAWTHMGKDAANVGGIMYRTSDVYISGLYVVAVKAGGGLFPVASGNVLSGAPVLLYRML